MSDRVRVLADDRIITSNQAKEHSTVLFNLIHNLKAGQFNIVIGQELPSDPEFNKVYEAVKELAVILEQDNYRLSILSRQVKVFIENMEDKDRPALRVV
jgi:hypothetical protein